MIPVCRLILLLLAVAVVSVKAATTEKNVKQGGTIRGREQKCLYCHIDVLIAEFEGDNEPGETEFMCTSDEDEEESGLGDMMYSIDLPEEFVSAHLNTIMHGEAYVCIPGGTFGGVRDGPGERFIAIPKDSEIVMADRSKSDRYRHRQLQQAVSTVGPRRTLVVRLIGASGSEQPGVTAHQLMGAVFGLGPEPFENSMREQFQRCSFNQIDFVPAGNYPGVENGVVQITVPYSVKGVELHNTEPDVISRIERQFNVRNLHSNFEHVLFIFPAGAIGFGKASWSAFGSLYEWRSWFNSDKGGQLQVLMHEMGHNLGLEHANERWEYGDETGMMGGGNYQLDTPLKCFNGQKNWQLGWYKDKQFEINSGSSWAGKLVSFVDYDQANPSRNEYVLLKTGDLYIQYNRKKGFNSQTRENWNKVTIALMEIKNKRLIQSEMLVGLDSGLTATAFGVRITVCYRSAGPPDYAFVSIRPRGQPSNCPQTPADAISKETTKHINPHKSCTEASLCSQCEGRCSRNDQCGAGLVCMTDTGYKDIPGCRSDEFVYGGICVSSQLLQKTPAPTPFPTNRLTPAPTPVPGPGSNDPRLYATEYCKAENPCGRCEGACTDDNQCEKGLKCFKRNGYTAVPGCRGSGQWDIDYCFATNTPEPTIAITPQPTIANTPEPTITETSQPVAENTSPPMEAPVFPPIADATSQPIVDGTTTPPLESPVGSPVGTPTASRVGAHTPTSVGTSSVAEEETTAEADAMSNGCSDSSPCGKCETGCVDDNHCAPGLVCIHGGGDETILGCDGFDLVGSSYCNDAV